MKRLSSGILLAAITLSAWLAPAVLSRADLKTDAAGFVTLPLGDESWRQYPGISGIDVVNVYGDPAQPGVYMIRVRFHPGTTTMPHYHPNDRLVTVLKGTWWAGTSDRFDPNATQPIRAGGYMMHPAGGVHFDGAKDEEVVLQIAGMGPGSTTFVHPELGPTGKSR